VRDQRTQAITGAKSENEDRYQNRQQLNHRVDSLITVNVSLRYDETAAWFA
jgi:hypothetical protein